MEIKEIFKEYSNNTSLAEGHYNYMMDEEDFTNACKILISFHVKEALKEANIKAEAKIGAGERSYLYVDANSILNAYDLDNIK